MMATDERDVVTRLEDTPRGNPMGNPIRLVWLKSRQQVASLGLEVSLRATRVHNGQGRSTEGLPAAGIIFCPNGEDIPSEVQSARALSPDSIIPIYVASPNLCLPRGALETWASGLLHAGLHPEQILWAGCVALKGETELPRSLLSEWVNGQRPPNLEVLLSARQKKEGGVFAWR